MRQASIVLIFILIFCGSVSAQQQVPQASLEKLQDVFSSVRDRLWDQGDEYFHKGEFDRCIAAARVITAIDPHDVEAYTDAAWLMDSDLREEDSEAFLREGLANNPRVFDIYLELGNFCYFRERYDEAVPLLVGATCMDCPAYVWHQLAHCYEHAGRVGECLETWFEIHAMEPDNGVPPMQIDRILKGEEPSHVPESFMRSLQHRQEDRAKGLPD